MGALLLSGGLRELLQAVPGRGGSEVMESFRPKVHLSGEAGLEMTLCLPSSLIMSCRDSVELFLSTFSPPHDVASRLGGRNRVDDDGANLLDEVTVIKTVESHQSLVTEIRNMIIIKVIL